MDSDICVLLNSFHSYFSKKFSLSDSEMSCVHNLFLYSSDKKDFLWQVLGMSKTMYYSVLTNVKYKLSLASNFSDTNVCVVYLHEFMLFLLSSVYSSDSKGLP